MGFVHRRDASPVPGAPTMAPDMNRVEVTGDVGTLRFPAMCARCGAPPAGVLPLSKMFRRTYDNSDARTRYLHAQVSVPFCRSCVAAHDAARRPPDPRVLRRLCNRWLLSCLPYVVPIVVIVWLGSKLAPSGIEAVASRDVTGMLVWGGILAFLALSLWGFVRLVLAGRNALIADYDPGPDELYPENPNDCYVEFARGPLGINCILPGAPTPTLASVDFGDEKFELLASNRRAFRFANPEVGAAFAAANAERVWDPASPRAVRTRVANYVILALFMAFGLFLLVRDLMTGR